MTTEQHRSSASKVRLGAAIRFCTFFLLASGCLLAFSGNAVAGDDPEKSGKMKIAPYALIFGTVWDTQSRPAYGVPIKIRRADEKKTKWTLRSDHRGEFAQRVPAGAAEYVIWADLKAPKGKKDWKAPEAKVVIQNDERVDVSLHLTE